MVRRAIYCTLALLLLASFPSYGSAESEAAPVGEPEMAPGPAVIEIEAGEYAFFAPPRFPSGWVTLRFANEGTQTHFLLLWRLPEGKIFDDYTSQVAQPFKRLYKAYRAGELEQQEFLDQLLAELPDWFGDARQAGGPGFTSPGLTSQTTIFLEPGEYVMECYVRSEEEGDTFHSEHGMLRPLFVTEAASAQGPPEADIQITLSNYEIAVVGEPSAGEQTVRVRVAEDPEGLIRHNVHLARLGEGTAGEEVAAWLDWVDAMLPPAPAEFLGGAEQLPAGSESYFTVSLSPGRYAWVSETWGVKGMVREFVVE